eukprot:COSAG01_NODE_34521_length_546_cov_0.946309_1_plen_46_part_00
MLGRAMLIVVGARLMGDMGGKAKIRTGQLLRGAVWPICSTPQQEG